MVAAPLCLRQAPAGAARQPDRGLALAQTAQPDGGSPAVGAAGQPEALPADPVPGRDGAQKEKQEYLDTLAAYQNALEAMPNDLPDKVGVNWTDYNRRIDGRKALDSKKWADTVKAYEEALEQKKREAEREREQKESTDRELAGVQVPIPKVIRQFNHSSNQCVWCTIATLCRYHNVEPGKQITDQYRHPTVPAQVDRVLRSKGIKFKQVYGRDEDFLEEYVTRKKLGVGIGVNGNHVVLVCHFDKAKDEVKFINNLDPDLRIWTCDMQEFRRHFTGWVFVILPPGHPDAGAGAKGT
jgi:hypothetical protein